MGDVLRNVNVRLDTQTITSNHWINPTDMDYFKDEVQTISPVNRILQTPANSIHKKESKGNPDCDNDWKDKPSLTWLSKCVDRWENADSEQKKKMFTLFDKTGILLACCRHEFALLVCDMIKTGEQ